MRSLIRAASFAALSFSLSITSLACSSSDGNGTPAPTKGESQLGPAPPPDDGFAWATPPGPTTVSITGQGGVYSGDADRSVVCTGDGTATTGTCVARQQTTLYAAPMAGWFFTQWLPGGQTTETIYVDPATPAQITAVFSTRTH